MNKIRKTLIIGLSIGLLMLSAWLYFFDFNALKDNLMNLNVGYVLLSLLSYVLAYFVRSLRWNQLLIPTKKVKVKETYLWSLAGNFVNYLIPIRAGELAKAIIAKRNSNIAIASSLPSIFIDKFFDTIGIFIILIMIPFLHIQVVPALNWLITVLLIVFTLGILILIGAIVAEDKLIKLLHKCFYFIPEKYQNKVFDFIELFVKGTAIFKEHSGILIKVIFFTALGIILDGIYFYLMFKAFGFINVSLSFIFFGYTLLNLSYILPQPPAQLGSNEWLMTLIFVTGMGMNLGEASSLMAFAHIATGIIVSLLGILAMSMIGVKVVDLIKRSSNE